MDIDRKKLLERYINQIAEASSEDAQRAAFEEYMAALRLLDMKSQSNGELDKLRAAAISALSAYFAKILGENDIQSMKDIVEQEILAMEQAVCGDSESSEENFFVNDQEEDKNKNDLKSIIIKWYSE